MEETYHSNAGAAALPELVAFLASFAQLLRRTWSRQTLRRYLSNVLSDLPCKNYETIAASVAR